MKRIILSVLLLAFLASPAQAGQAGGAIPQILNPDVGAAAVPDLKGKVHLQVRVVPPRAGGAIADIVGVRFLPSAAGTPDIGTPTARSAAPGSRSVSRRDHDTISGQRILEDVYGQGVLVLNLLPGARVKVVGTDLSNTKATKEVIFQP